MSLEHFPEETNSWAVKVQPHRTLAEVARLMTDLAIGKIVVTASDGVVMGVVSQRDIIRAISLRGAEALDDMAYAHMTFLGGE